MKNSDVPLRYTKEPLPRDTVVQSYIFNWSKNMGTHHTVLAVYREAESGATGNQLPLSSKREVGILEIRKKTSIFSLIPKIMKKGNSIERHGPQPGKPASLRTQPAFWHKCTSSSHPIRHHSPFSASLKITSFYEGFAFPGVMLVGTIFYYNRLSSWHAILRKLLLTTFPRGSSSPTDSWNEKSFHYLFPDRNRAPGMMLF